MGDLSFISSSHFLQGAFKNREIAKKQAMEEKREGKWESCNESKA